jgi:nicotinic acid mononucleotide adenylyltransferase
MAGTTLRGRERRRLASLAAALARARDGGGPPRLEPVAGRLPAVATAGLLAGTFNPFTRAHAALAVAGHRAGCQLVVLAMAPVSLAKEGLERAHPVDRLDWAAAWARRHPWAAVAAASHPLLVDMAEALGRATGGEVALVLGTDKAAQLVEPHWYDDPAAALERLDRAASLLVAERAGHPARGLPLDDLLPVAVARGVERTGAYAPGDAYLVRIRELEALTTSGGPGKLRFRPEAPDRRR